MKTLILIIQLLFLSGSAFAGLLSGLLNPFTGDPPERGDYSNVTCKRTCYRSYNGSCNNLRYPQWGAAGTLFTRLFDSYSYEDGKCEIAELTNPREISLDFVGKDAKDPIWTLYTPQFGQMLAHDMTLANGVTETGAEVMDCPCVDGKIKKMLSVNEQCSPIMIPKWDPYNNPAGVQCYDFVRTQSTCFEGTKPSKPGEQYNTVTSFIDCSPLYGNNEKQANKLRRFKHGMLDYVIIDGRMYPPQDKDPKTCDDAGACRRLCIFTGDIRANQNPHIALMQIILLRYHNKIAKILCKKINKHWTDEICFQETRKIVIGTFQHVTYSDYLPFVLGKKNMKANGLISKKHLSFEKGYDDKVNPSTINEFATAAFRIFHNTIDGHLRLYDMKRKQHGVVEMSEQFNNASVLLNCKTELYMAIGASIQHQQAVDTYYSPTITEKLFIEQGAFQGQDLFTTDIYRGRDHGLAKYIIALKKCGILKVTTFKDFLKVMPAEHVEILKRHYKKPEDVDLLVGGVLETVLKGQLTGKTFNCILLEQFKRTKFGDHYFYTFKHKCSLSKDQLKEIGKQSMASLMCKNAGNFPIQPRAFERPSSDNKIGPCSDLPSIDLTKWKEDPKSCRDSKSCSEKSSCD